VVKASISCALRKEGLERIPQYTGQHLSLIKEDTESWACAQGVPRRYLDGGYAGSTTRWSRNGIMKELLVE